MPRTPRVVRNTAYGRLDSPSLVHVSPICSISFRESPGREYDITGTSTPMPFMLISCDETCGTTAHTRDALLPASRSVTGNNNSSNNSNNKPSQQQQKLTARMLRMKDDKVQQQRSSEVVNGCGMTSLQRSLHNAAARSNSTSGSSGSSSTVRSEEGGHGNGRRSLSRSLPYSWCSAYAEETPSTTRARWLHCQTFGRVVPSIAESSSTATADSSSLFAVAGGNGANDKRAKRKARRTRRWGPAELVWGYVEARRAMQITPRMEAWPATHFHEATPEQTVRTTAAAAAVRGPQAHGPQRAGAGGGGNAKGRWYAPVRHEATRAPVNRILFSTADGNNTIIIAREDEEQGNDDEKLNRYRDIATAARPNTTTAAMGTRMYNGLGYGRGTNNEQQQQQVGRGRGGEQRKEGNYNALITTGCESSNGKREERGGLAVKSLSASCQLGLPPSSTDSLVCAAPRRHVVMSNHRNNSSNSNNKREEEEEEPPSQTRTQLQTSLLLLSSSPTREVTLPRRSPRYSSNKNNNTNTPITMSSSDEEEDEGSGARKAAQARKVGAAWRAKAAVRVPMSRLARGRILHPLFVDDMDDSDAYLSTRH